MQFTAAAGLPALVYAFVNFLRYLTSKSWRSALTQAVAWAAGLGGVFLFSATQWANQVQIGSESLQHLNAGSKIVVGLLFSSLGSVVQTVIKAVDGTQSAQVPVLGAALAPAQPVSDAGASVLEFANSQDVTPPPADPNTIPQS